MSNEPETRNKPNPFFNKLGIVVLIIIAIWMSSQMFGSSLLEEGTVAPSWTLQLTDGSHDKMSLGDLKGKVVLLSFWSTTCPPCMKELKDLDAMWPKYRQKDVVFVGIASGGETAEQVHAFNKNKRLEFPLVVDNGQTADNYLVRAIPVVYVIDPEGKVFEAYTGYRGRNKLENMLNKALSAFKK